MSGDTIRGARPTDLDTLVEFTLHETREAALVELEKVFAPQTPR